ncbi:MAG: ATP phosphoribosyltransferase [Candidatus Calescibacterium sp.]|nr:ATP phosphoribosyltransferase [Candidatus Calescibacterium sp.]MCX7734669.1 ATP phosphoribosyltransferase [bacterium]MDW8087794.1 ATP phosphoribosyltransferase [Candidatus Calescibacterium sp.]
MKYGKKDKKLKIALSKGRILDEELSLLQKGGIYIKFDERELSCETENFKFWLIKPHDVPTWVESGVVDLGIVGLDVIRETRKDILELMNLEIGKCRLSLACREEDIKSIEQKNKKIYIATKFPNLTKEYASKFFHDFEIIHLQGSVEVAPQVGLAQFIVDLVSTGKTLKENNLVEVKILMQSSAYLIANRTSFIIKYEDIENFLKIMYKTCGRNTYLFS